MTTTKIISTVIYVLFIMSTFFTVGNMNQYFDLASLIVVIVIASLYTISVKSDESYIKKFGQGAVRAGWLGSMIGVIAIFGSEGFSNGNMEAIGSAFAVASLTVLYGYLLQLGCILLD